MKAVYRLTLLGVFVASLLLSACGSTAAPTPEPTLAPIVAPTSTPVPATSTPVPATATAAQGGYQPVSLQVCQAVHDAVAKALVTRFTLIDAPFTDPISGESGMACTMEASGTGADFENVASVMEKLRAALTGWQQNPAYAADGPTGTATAFTRDNALLLVMVEWQPSPDANCPQDQPISACLLKPEQQLYTITLKAAQK